MRKGTGRAKGRIKLRGRPPSDAEQLDSDADISQDQQFSEVKLTPSIANLGPGRFQPEDQQALEFAGSKDGQGSGVANFPQVFAQSQ